MRPLIVGLALLIAGAAAAQPVQLPIAFSRDWKRIRSDNFTAIGNGSESQLRSALVQLERFRSALQSALPDVRIESSVPNQLILFKDNFSLEPFNPRDDAGRLRYVTGYTARLPHATMLVGAAQKDRDDTFRIIFHDYAHYVAQQTGRPIPVWMDEGLAEFYSTFRMTGPATGVVGGLNRQRAQTFRNGTTLLSFEELFTTEGAARAFRNPALRERFYAQAWALVHYLTLGKRAGQLIQYQQALEKGLAPQQAFDATFDVSYTDLMLEMRAYLRQLTLPALVVDFPVRLAAATNPVEYLTESDALALQAELLLAQGVPRDAEPLIDRAVYFDPTHAGARRLRAAVQRDRREWSEAVATLRAVTSSAPRDFAAQYWLAHDLTNSGDKDGAMQAAVAAVTLNEHSPEAWLELSLAAHVLGRSSQADAGMTRARQLLRNPEWYRVRAQRFWWLGDDAAVVRDVQSYIDDVGWGNERVPEAVFLAALSHRRLGDAGKAAALLARAAPSIDDDSWTAALAGFLRGTLQRQVLLNRAKGPRQQAHAHAYAGLVASIDGRLDEALRDLQWVRANARHEFAEYHLAIAELRRLEAAVPRQP